ASVLVVRLVEQQLDPEVVLVTNAALPGDPAHDREHDASQDQHGAKRTSTANGKGPEDEDERANDQFRRRSDLDPLGTTAVARGCGHGRKPTTAGGAVGLTVAPGW